MTRELTEREEVQLSACLEEAGVKDLGGLLEHLRDLQSNGLEVEFNDPNLIKIEFPKPDGKLGSVYVHVVNEFEKYSRNRGTYPKYPNQLGETFLAMNVGAILGVTTSTARKKIRQLSGTGWLVSKHRSIQNPVATYEMAFRENAPHPSFVRHIE